MKSLIAPLVALAVLATAAGAALAAPPAYCALYAREYANQFAEAAGEKPGSEPKIQDEAYYRCLNMDQEPEMPTTSAYYGTSVDPVADGGQGGPLEPVPGDGATTADSNSPLPDVGTPVAPAKQKAAAATGNDAATGDAPTPPKPIRKTASNTSSGHSYTGGKTPWTPEWLAACRKYFPHSFNEKDGTILPYGANKRVLCR